MPELAGLRFCPCEDSPCKIPAIDLLEPNDVKIRLAQAS